MKLNDKDPRALLPLKPIIFDILVILAAREAHGWSIVKALEAMASGRKTILPGNLYRTLRSMLSNGLITESEARPDPEIDDERRRYYRVTEFGVAVAQAEGQRLEKVLGAARAASLLPANGGPR